MTEAANTKKENPVNKALKYLLCYVNAIKFKDLSRHFPKGEMDSLKKKLEGDRRFSLFEDDGVLMVRRVGVSEEEARIRDNVLEWKERVMEFFRENGLQTPIKLSEIVAEVPRPKGVDSSSISSRCVLEADYNRKFDLVELRVKPSDALIKYVYSQDEWGRYKHENSVKLEEKKEEWRQRIIFHLLKQKVSVRLNTLGVSAKKPNFLPPKIKCSDVIREDPLKRFQITGTAGATNEKGKNDSGMLYVSLSRDYLAEHWRLQIVKHMTEKGVNMMLLSDLGNVVPRPYLLPRQCSLVDVITADPKERFYYTCKNDVRRVKLLTEEEKEVVYSSSISPTSTVDSNDGWTVVGAKPNVAKPQNLGAWEKKMVLKTQSPPPGFKSSDVNSSKQSTATGQQKGSNTAETRAIKEVDPPDESVNNSRQWVNENIDCKDDHLENGGAVMEEKDFVKAEEDEDCNKKEDEDGESNVSYQQQPLGIALEPRNDIFDFQSSAPGLFASFGDKNESYFHQGHIVGNGKVDVGNYGVGHDPLQLLSLGQIGENVPSMLSPPTTHLSVQSPVVNGNEDTAPERMWIRNWLPVAFEGFPSPLIEQYVTLLAEEGMVSVQDLITANDLGQLTLEFFKDIGITCKIGHYNRLISALSKYN